MKLSNGGVAWSLPYLHVLSFGPDGDGAEESEEERAVGETVEEEEEERDGGRRGPGAERRGTEAEGGVAIGE